MRLVKCGATFLACSVAIAAGSSAALARPQHRHHIRHHERVAHHAAHHRHLRAEYRSGAGHTMAAVPMGAYRGPGSMPEYLPSGSQAEAAVAPVRHSRVRGRVVARHDSVAAEPTSGFGGLGGDALVADARRYLGTNPTNRRTLWCGAFMDKILRDTGHRGGGNLAKGYLHYGHRVSGPQVGAIAVMGRRGGGHVGVVSGVDPNGNPIIVSGNHNRTVAESVYPRSRIIAYVEPGS
jgi:uncharacterized protein (TIGR02594 family)